MAKKNSNIKVGLLGLGYWGKNILRNLYELGVLDTACDSNLKVIEERKKDFPLLKFTTSCEDILKNPQINALVIATPAATHSELTKKALNANKDIFVEKPLALKYDKGKKLVVLAKEKNKILMVGHILQYHPAVIKLKKIVKEGKLGKVQYIYSNRLNIGKLRVEENILWSFAPHDISVILALTEEEPLKINSFGESYLSEGVYDVTLTTLEFKDKVKAHIFVSWLHPYKEQKLIIVGTKAMAVFDDLTEEKLFVYPHRIEWENGRIPVAYKAQHYPVEVEDKEPLKEEMGHFIECVSGRKTPKTDGNEALRVLRVLEEAEKSIIRSRLDFVRGKYKVKL